MEERPGGVESVGDRRGRRDLPPDHARARMDVEV